MNTPRKKFRAALSRVLGLSRFVVVGAAVARGATVAAGLLPAGAVPKDVPGLPHELLGCALLVGDETDAAFKRLMQAGAMILGDLNNLPERVIEAARGLHVEDRVAHIANEALKAGDSPAYWSAVIEGLPAQMLRAEHAAWPGVGALTTAAVGGSGAKWMRTTWARTMARQRAQSVSEEIVARARRVVAQRRISDAPGRARRR